MFQLSLTLGVLTATFGFSSINKLRTIKLEIVDRASMPNGDASSIPFDTIECGSIDYSNDFVSQSMPRDAYVKCATWRHEECISLFDRYTTSLIRCEVVDETSLNMRWNATWIPVGSNWLYDFANVMNWEVTSKSPDPSMRVVFSWKNVFDLFGRAFATGKIALPISLIEGSTIVRVIGKSGCADLSLSVKESIDLVAEADKGRLQNRRVAQELASWLDIRRPPDYKESKDVETWASIVRQRILSGVAGAGALDVDPMEEGEAGIALVLSGAVSLAALILSFQYFLVPEIVGGTGSVPAKCDDAEVLEFGYGYLSECFGPFGDPIYEK